MLGLRPSSDLYDMVNAMENDLPVPFCRPILLRVGWSVPVEHWPTFEPEVMTMGDADIGALLYGRSVQCWRPSDAPMN